MATPHPSRPPHAWRRFFLGLCAILAVAGLVAGCGKKGPPKLPNIEAPAGVTNLTAVQQGEEIVLTWTAPAAAGYQVYRSAEPAVEGDCEGCPILFKRVAKLPSTSKGETPPSMVYREPSMPGTRYYFKVVPYDDQGQLGPDSNIATIVTD
jgi:predicted small lipoprotein YifL